MARSRRAKKFDARTSHCLYCGQALANQTPEDQAKIALHRVLHIEDRQERLRFSHHLIAEQYQIRHQLRG
jgi:hypothetical protein